MKTLAIDIGGTKFALAVFEGDALVRRHSEATDRNGGPGWMLGRIEKLALQWIKDHDFERCGISFGGPVNFERQVIYQSTHVRGWDDFDLPGWVKQRTGVPAIMDNDANCGALGEARHGAGRECRSMFYMTLSTGIGGGIVVDGRLIRGENNVAGELGHMTIRPEGPECLCGARGCLERLCAGLWLERDYGKPAKELMDDPEFVRQFVVDLGLGIKNVIMLLNPQRVVIGGGISKAGDRLFVPLREELDRQVTAWSRATIDVMPAERPDDCTLYGAMELMKGI